jgi:hypothetical protein
VQAGEIFKLYQSFEEHLFDELLEEVWPAPRPLHLSVKAVYEALIVSRVPQDDDMDGDMSPAAYVRCWLCLQRCVLSGGVLNGPAA